VFFLIESIKWQHISFQYLHDLAIATYIGGAVAMEFILGPAQRSIPPAQAQVMGQKTANRFLWLVWGSLVVIIITGLLRLWRLSMLDADWPFFHSPLDFSHSYGRTVFMLLGIWAILAINGTIITFYLRPRLAGRFSSQTSATQVQRGQQAKIQAAHWVEILTRVDLGLALLAALLGASLAFGGVW
jgi:uncharacterized membrane protein